MEQTFNDLLRERAAEGRSLFGCAFWMFSETAAGIFREKTTLMIKRNKNIIRMAIATFLILLIPFLAMQFTDDVDWSVFDFVSFGALLFGSGLMYELITRKSGNKAYRAAVGVALAAVFFLVWINGAVGIIGNEDHPANIMYFWVIGIGIIGAFMARLRPLGMSRALFVTAAAQMLVPVIALIIGSLRVGSSQEIFYAFKVLTLNSFFVMLFVGSGLLFRQSGKAESIEPKA